MAIIPSLSTATSGIQAFQRGLTVISDNIANVDTIAFKENDILFSEMINRFSHSHGGSRYQTGDGALTDQIRAPFRQGLIERTQNPLDLAIEGKGFFVLEDPFGEATPFFSRAGAFHVDKNGLVVNIDGLLLQGTAIEIDPVTGLPIPGAGAGPIDLSNRVSPPRATTEVLTSINLASKEFDIANTFSGKIPVNPNDETIPFEGLIINGVTFDEIGPGIESLIEAINEQTELTGVSAKEDVEFLMLTNANGGPIVIDLNTLVDPTIPAKTGLSTGTFFKPNSLSQVLTGVVTPSDADGEEKVFLGTDTKFLSEIRAGDSIIVSNRSYIVQAVQSDTQ